MDHSFAKPNLGFKYYCGWDLLFALHLVKILGAGYAARLPSCPVVWNLGDYVTTTEIRQWRMT